MAPNLLEGKNYSRSKHQNDSAKNEKQESRSNTNLCKLLRFQILIQLSTKFVDELRSRGEMDKATAL